MKLTDQLADKSPLPQQFFAAMENAKPLAIIARRSGKTAKSGRLTFVIKGCDRRFIVIAGPGTLRLAQFRDDLNPSNSDEDISEMAQRITLRGSSRALAVKLLDFIDINDQNRQLAIRNPAWRQPAADWTLDWIRKVTRPAFLKTETGIAPKDLQDLILKVLRLSQCRTELRLQAPTLARVSIHEHWRRVEPMLLAIEDILEWHKPSGSQPFIIEKRCGRRMPLMADLLGEDFEESSGHDLIEAAALAQAALEVFYRKASTNPTIAERRPASLAQLGLSDENAPPT